jgi:hypothetical protein
MRTYTFKVSRNQLIGLVSSLLLLMSGVAYGISVDNTPANGYLLCANNKSHAVIYPGKLSCPVGYTQLELGAQGPAGQDGAQGPAGPAGQSAASTTVTQSSGYSSEPSKNLTGINPNSWFTYPPESDSIQSFLAVTGSPCYGFDTIENMNEALAFQQAHTWVIKLYQDPLTGDAIALSTPSANGQNPTADTNCEAYFTATTGIK